MKKLRLERQGQTVSTLSQKRGSLNQEQLFVPYKVDWRAASPINVENNHTNKAFFQNMKAELSTIKNDFQKLIRKEINLKVQEDEPLKTMNSNKPKHYSTSKKDTRSISENERLQVVMSSKKNQEDHFNKILNLEKNLPCSSGNQIKQTLVKTLKVKEQVPQTTQFNTVQIESPLISQNYLTNENEVYGLKEKINFLQIQLQNEKMVIQSLQTEARMVREQNELISSKASELSHLLSLRDNLLKQKEGEIQQLNEQLSFVSEQSNHFKMMEHNWMNERNYLNQQLHQLSYHNQQLNISNQQFAVQNNQLRVTIDGLQRFCQDLQNRCSDIENDWKRKLQYLQKDIASYQKREDMFASQIEKLNLQLTESLPEASKISSASDNDMRTEIIQLKDEIFHLKRQVALQKQLHQNLAKKCQEKADSTTQIQELSRTFQYKINQLLDQNVRLKTKINHSDSKVQSLQEQNKSYVEQIRLYQQRENKTNTRRKLHADEWQTMTEEIEKLKEINQKLSEQLQFKQFSKENQQSSQHNICNQELITLSHEQRKQIELLKHQIKQLVTNNKQLQQRMLFDINLGTGLTKGVLQIQLQKKMNQIKLLKQMIFSIIVEKLGKKQDEEEIQYYLRSLDQIKSKMIV